MHQPCVRPNLGFTQGDKVVQAAAQRLGAELLHFGGGFGGSSEPENVISRADQLGNAAGCPARRTAET